MLPTDKRKFLENNFNEGSEGGAEVRISPGMYIHCSINAARTARFFFSCETCQAYRFLINAMSSRSRSLQCCGQYLIARLSSHSADCGHCNLFIVYDVRRLLHAYSGATKVNLDAQRNGDTNRERVCNQRIV